MSKHTGSPDGQPLGEALEHAFAAILRWSTRPEVRRRLVSDDAEQFSTTDAWFIEHLVHTGAVRMTSLAEWQGVDKSTVTAQIKRLEAKDLVSRHPDPTDGRAVLVEVTRAGRALRRRNSAAARVLFEDLVSEWSSRERTQLVGLLDKLVDRLDGEE